MLRKMWAALGITTFWICWPAIYLYAPRTKRTRVIVQAGDQVLLVKGWLSDGRWSLPGGGLHHQEPILQGAARELNEETGLVVAPADIKQLAQERCRVTGIPMRYVYCSTTIAAVQAITKPSLELTDAQWFPMGQIQQLLVQPAVRRAVQLIADRN